MTNYQTHEIIGDGWTIKRNFNRVTMYLGADELFSCDIFQVKMWRYRLKDNGPMAKALDEVLALWIGETEPAVRAPTTRPAEMTNAVGERGGCFGLVLAVLVSLPVVAWFGVVAFCWMDW